MYKIDVEQLEDLKSFVLVLDEKGKILKFNNYASESTGYSTEEVVSSSWFDTFLGKNEKDEISVYFQENLQKKNKSWHSICNINCKDGTKKYINWTFCIFNNTQEETYILAIGTDISLMEELKSKDQLIIQQSKMAAMGEMLETIAHQWRQPLSIISTATSGLRMKKEFEILSDDDFYKSCDNIIDIVNHLSSTIDDFRNFFKPNKNKELFNLKNALEKTFTLVESKFKNSDIEIIFELSDVDIYGFENELIQALMVILNNARDAFLTQDKKTKKYIFIKLYEDNYDAILSIKDSAGGIPENILYKIFNPYFTTKQDSNGTGIGLYMTDEIVSKHMNGFITAVNATYTYKDEDLKGAEFIIKLPSLKKEKIQMKFLEELENCNCYRWNKDEEMFIKLPSSNDKLVLQEIATLSKFLYGFDVKFTILNNQNIQVHF